METPPALAGLPVEEGARRLALWHFDALKVARGRLRDSSDPEALHDYRVALRRLRSCLRAYPKELGPKDSRTNRRALTRLARGTNESRDLEVHLGWLAEQRDAGSEADRAGILWLIERLSEAKRRKRDELLGLDEKLFPEIEARLSQQLSHLPSPGRLDGSVRRSTAAVTVRRARKAARRLHRRLGRIRGYSSETEIHRARIAAKHLRYLLEPFAPDLPGGDATVARLKSLQDGLGEVHDAQVLAGKLRGMPDRARAAGRAEVVGGLRALLVAVRARGRKAFEKSASELRYDFLLGDARNISAATLSAAAGSSAKNRSGSISSSSITRKRPPTSQPSTRA